MPTVKQKKAFDRLVENGGNVSSAMRDVGYSPKTAKTPQKLTESKAYREAFNVERAKGVLGEILEIGQEGNKVKAAQEIFKVEGAYAPEKHDTRNINIDLTKREEITKIAKEVIKKLQEDE